MITSLIPGGLSLFIIDEWIDSINDNLRDSHYPTEGDIPKILEDLNFCNQFNPAPLSTI